MSQLAVRTQLINNLVYEYCIKGMSSEDIHAALSRHGLDIGITMTYRYIKRVKEDMKSRRMMDMSERIDRELAVLETIRNRALDSYRMSLNNAEYEETTEETIPVTQAPVNVNATQQEANNALVALLQGRAQIEQVRRVTKRKSVGQSGDPRFLDTALRASEQIRKLLGIDHEEVARVTNVNILNVNHYSREDLLSMDPAELARYVGEQISAT